MSTYAVIATGGKQYLVEPGKAYKFEKLEGEPGATISFDQVLLTFDAKGEAVRVGTPVLTDVRVTGTVVRQARTRKLVVMKYKAKSRYRRKQGHRQHFTEVKISAIAAV
ncbi:50S ribosomal protein L21 [Candidatus Uhrbacteria bacterium]|nr:50S ribosomal protein L21 [Candidatus Uhrbacteria bacterium]